MYWYREDELKDDNEEDTKDDGKEPEKPVCLFILSSIILLFLSSHLHLLGRKERKLRKDLLILTGGYLHI